MGGGANGVKEFGGKDVNLEITPPPVTDMLAFSETPLPFPIKMEVEQNMRSLDISLRQGSK